MLNSTNKRFFAIAIVLLLAANIATLILLWTHSRKGTPDNPGPRGEQVFEFVTKELGLDSVQQKAYAALRTEHQQGSKALQDSIRIAKDVFFGSLKDSSVSDATIMSQGQKVADAEERLEMLTFRHFQKLRTLCRPDQQQKFDKIIEDVLHRIAQPRGPGRPPRGQQGPPPVDGRMPPPPEDHGGPKGEQGPPPEDGQGPPPPGH
jgi:hypothetical protein